MIHYHLRIATQADIPAIQEVIAASTRGLSAEYTPAQNEAALQYIYGVDTELLDDQSYFVIECDTPSDNLPPSKARRVAGGSEALGACPHKKISACGGWSRRKTLFGGDNYGARESGTLNPATDPAKIRAFFVHPDHARKGLGKMLLQHSEAEARAHGFTSAEMMATLPGIKLYAAMGYQPIEPFEFAAPNGVIVPFVRMQKSL